METKTLLILLAFLHLTVSQEFNGECYTSSGVPARCEPIRQSFSFGQVPTVNSTCGSPPNTFCFRSVRLGVIMSECTGICNATDPENAHPPSYMTDFLLEDRWWQSENTVNTVMIELSLQTLVEISVISFDFQSLIPNAFYIEKSTDYGQTYEPFHFFSTSCLDQYMIDPDVLLDHENETTILCQQIDIPPAPGQISFFPALGRPSTNDSVPGYSEELYDFVTATDIRVFLDGHFEIENLAPDDAGYYYAIQDLNVLGSCQCHGHASSCPIDPDTSEYFCECSHNTAGTFCEHCADFFQDVPWQRANGREPFECKSCNCHEHSSECEFNPDVYEATGRVSGGVCLNCTDNTIGRQCESCAEFFYPRPDRNQTDPDVCAMCSCDLRGVTNDGDCAKESDANIQPGDCFCKVNVVGRTCSECSPGFFNLSAANPDGCQACDCNANGSISTVCDPVTGTCGCKPNVVGDNCDRCRTGFYQTDPSNQAGCQPCNCNLGGSISEQCDMSTGQCECRRGITGVTCSEILPGFFIPVIDHLRLEGERASGVPSYEILTDGEGVLFTGTGYYSVIEGMSIANFGTLTVPASGEYEVLFRYNLRGAAIWSTATLLIQAGSEEGSGPVDCLNATELPLGNSEFAYTSWMMGMGLTISQTFCFRAGRPYTFILDDFDSGLPDNSTAVLEIDSLILIPVHAPGLQVFSDPTLQMEYANCVDSWRSLQTQPSASSTCEQTTFTVLSEVYNGTLECDCDPTGSVFGTTCAMFGGQCECQEGVRGRQCNECKPGTHNLSPQGCTNCSCNLDGSASEICDPFTGACSCFPNVVGPNCSLCIANFWGLASGAGCMECNCSAIGSLRSQCNEDTGLCFCQPGVAGDQCDECIELHYGFSEDGCSPCNCSEAGSTEEFCGILNGQCSCKSNTEGRDCSQCVVGTFNVEATNPFGCQPCFCSGQSNICFPAPEYFSSVVISEFNSSDLDPLQGWMVVSSSLNTSEAVENVVGTTPFSVGVVLIANSSAYLQAPGKFLGNKLSSYSHFLEIVLEPLSNTSQVRSLLSYDIVIVGSGIQLGTAFPPTSTFGVTLLRVQLHETFGWTNIDTNLSANAYELQLVLSTLDQLLITASYSFDTTIYSISLDTALSASGTINISNSVSWVEQCECPMNYTGLSCEQCESGYSRTPSGNCELCQCNGLATTCDPESGECMNCTGNTAGPSCELCIDGTYRDVNGFCQLCPCPLTAGVGQFTENCVLQSGGVLCLNCPPGHTGQQCEACVDGFFGDPLGTVSGTPTMCSDCLCNGNVNTSIPGSCDTLTGICLTCLFNTAGDLCERCADGFYGDAITAKNCTECDCDSLGSNGTTCQTTGQCQCLLNVEGLRCDHCATNHYGISSGSGCTPCDCNGEGSNSTQCNVITGECVCRPGVTGRTCDQCLPGFFGLSSGGCQACACSSVNSMSDICDDDGSCICEPGATGPDCGVCSENYFQTANGCIDCPECYQELQAQADVIRDSLNRTTNRIFTLALMLSPFEPRLRDSENMAQSVLDEAENISDMHNLLLNRFQSLAELLSVSLWSQVVRINNSLILLQASTTPVFVLASTAEELMNRTIQELTAAIEISNIIATQDLPMVQASVESIGNSSIDGVSAATELEDQVMLLSTQLVQLQYLADTIALLSSQAIDRAQQIQSLHANTTDMLNLLQVNFSTAQTSISSLAQQLQSLSGTISSTLTQIDLGIANLASLSVPQLDDLLTNASMTSDYANSIANETNNQSSQLAELQEVLDSSQQETESLVSSLSMLSESANSFESESRDAQNSSSEVQRIVEDDINNAEFILTQLQSFRNESFEVANAATEALELVHTINDTAATGLSAASQIQQTIGESAENVSMAKTLATQADSKSLSVEQDSLDVATTAFNAAIAINANVNDTLIAKESINASASEASSILGDLTDQKTAITAAEQETATAANLALESERVVVEVQQTVYQLQEEFLNLANLDLAKLREVEAFIQRSRDEITADDLSALYQTLRGELLEQQTRRERLQDDVATFEETLSYLRRVNSILPQNCDTGA